MLQSRSKTFQWECCVRTQNPQKTSRKSFLRRSGSSKRSWRSSRKSLP
uniref:Uncharacterized protein n=1 Tax=Anguilla anguilla TaxID=7936 RepID=A0A0E9RZA2_ANGAN